MKPWFTQYDTSQNFQAGIFFCHSFLTLCTHSNMVPNIGAFMCHVWMCTTISIPVFKFLTQSMSCKACQTVVNLTICLSALKWVISYQMFLLLLLGESSPCSVNNGGCHDLCLLTPLGVVNCTCRGERILLDDNRCVCKSCTLSLYLLLIFTHPKFSRMSPYFELCG